MRLYKEDTLNIRINTLLKDKFQIATGFAGISSTILVFISDYVKEYEKQYGVIPMNLTNRSTHYDIITKFFGVKVNKKLYEKYNLEETLLLINQLLGTDIKLNEMEYFLQTYPKTRLIDPNHLKHYEDKI